MACLQLGSKGSQEVVTRQVQHTLLGKLVCEVDQMPQGHEAMLGPGRLFGETVRQVVAAFTPVDDILALGDTVFDPVKTHVHGF